MSGYVFKRIVRRPWLCLMGFLVSGLLCVLLCSLSSYRQGQQANLERVRDSYDLVCVVTDVRGTKSSSLRMNLRYVDFIEDEQAGLGSYAKDLRITKEFYATWPLGSGTMTGMTSERCSSLMDVAQGGAFSAPADFFDRDDFVCLVSQALYDSCADQTIQVQVVDPYGSDIEAAKGEADFQVVGWYSGMSVDLIIPYPSAQKLSGRIRGGRCADSLSFLLKDNNQAEKMLAASLSVFEPADPNSVSHGYAITVHDKQFKATIASLEQNIRRTTRLLPLMAVLSLGAGFLLGLLATRGEMRNYALMRTLGLGRGRLFVDVLLEQMLLPTVAALLTACVMGEHLPACVFLACHMVGCILSVRRPVLAPPTRLLRDQE